MPRVAESYLQSRRRQIMDAAIRCFAREGFHRTTMQDIFRETGLSAGAIYRYFKSKEDIVAAIAAEHRAVGGAWPTRRSRSGAGSPSRCGEKPSATSASWASSAAASTNRSRSWRR